MKIKTKIDGFTLIELIIVMIISSFVVMFSYSILNNYTETIKKKQNLIEEINKVYHFINLFKNDLNNTNEIIQDQNKICLASSFDTIYYNFLDSYLLRIKSQNIDTILLNKNEFKIINVSSANSIKIIKIIIKTRVSKEMFEIVFVKQEPVDVEINKILNSFSNDNY